MIVELLMALQVSVVSVYDADTMRVDIKGYPEIIGKNMPVRVKGIDAPEIRGKCDEEKILAIIARDYVRELVYTSERTDIYNINRGKYFRLLADVHVDGASIGDLLISKGYARRYDGGTKKSWCPEL